MPEDNEILLTVIITTHNLLEKEQVDDFNLLLQLLDLQTLVERETIIIDNQSDDGTVELLKEYKNKGYFTFYSEKDTSKFEGFNKGVLRAKGKYVMFLSCDDFIQDITALKAGVDLMEQVNADFLMSTAYCRHPDGYVFEFPPAPYNIFEVSPCVRQGMMFRKSAIAVVGYFDEKFKIMADYDLIIRLVMARCTPIILEKNIVTCKFGEKTFALTEKTNEEIARIFFKNYRTLYKMTDDVIEDMVNYSKFPKPLLEKLAEFYPPQDKQYFMDYAERIEQIRTEAVKLAKEEQEALQAQAAAEPQESQPDENFGFGSDSGFNL